MASTIRKLSKVASTVIEVMGLVEPPRRTAQSGSMLRVAFITKAANGTERPSREDSGPSRRPSRQGIGRQNQSRAKRFGTAL
jgi:hypothetical protein